MNVRRDLSALREKYESSGLDASEVAADPIDQFQTWFEEAVAAGVYQADAMTLSTVDADGWPAGRIVLLRGIDERGFVYYTNFQSAKAAAVEATGRAAVTLVWLELHRQIRVVGTVSRVTDKESDGYFAGRPPGSQIGAWASVQSQPIKDREALERAWHAAAARFAGADVPRPPHWGGYRLAPTMVEFWQGRPNRMHDRIRYDHSPGGWTISRLQP